MIYGVGNFAWVGEISKSDIEYAYAIDLTYEKLEIDNYLSETFGSLL